MHNAHWVGWQDVNVRLKLHTAASDAIAEHGVGWGLANVRLKLNDLLTDATLSFGEGGDVRKPVRLKLNTPW